MKKYMQTLNLWAILAFISGCVTPGAQQPRPNNCLERRAAFDIGSGTTKLKVADVDICIQKIQKIVLDAEEAVPYKESLQNSADQSLSLEIAAKGLDTLVALKNRAQKAGATRFSGVATSAFREAKNGAQIAAGLERELQFPIQIVSQDYEGHLGFLGAAAKADTNPRQIITWDIGGGSMQITYVQPDNRFQVYKSDVASVSFKEYIIRKIKRLPEDVESPNPIGKDHLKQAIKAAQAFASSLPGEIQQKLAKNQQQVIGIGGVHYYSIRGQLNLDEGQSYKRTDLRKVLNNRINATDEQIGGKYASTEVSNLILVLGFMEELGIKAVKPVKVNLTDGIFLDAELW